MKRSACHIIGMNGLGDSVFQRPFIDLLLEEYLDVYLTTPWPEIYPDVPVKFVRPETHQLRTQSKNLAVSTVRWETPPEHAVRLKFNYDAESFAQGTIMRALARCTKLDSVNGPLEFKIRFPHEPSLPAAVKVPKGKKLAVIRPVTERKEFWCPSRNPDPRYINWIAHTLRDSGYHTISIADVDKDNEFIVGRAPLVDQQFHSGELSVTDILQTLQAASMVVTGPNMMMPLAMATGAPLFIVFGGRGAFDTPAKLLDPRNDLRKVGWVTPDRFCRCDQMTHQCDKYIDQLPERFYEFLSRIQTQCSV